MTSLRLICCALAVLAPGAASLPDAPAVNLRGKAGESPIVVVTDRDGPVRAKQDDEMQIVVIYVIAAVLCMLFNKCCPGNIGKTHFCCCIPKCVPIGLSLGLCRFCSGILCCCPYTPGEDGGENESELVGEAKDQYAEAAGDAVGEQLGVEGLGDLAAGMRGGDAGGIMEGLQAAAEGGGMEGLGEAAGNIGEALGNVDVAGMAGNALEAMGGAEGVAGALGGMLGGGDGGDGGGDGGDGEGGGLFGALAGE